MRFAFILIAAYDDYPIIWIDGEREKKKKKKKKRGREGCRCDAIMWGMLGYARVCWGMLNS